MSDLQLELHRAHLERRARLYPAPKRPAPAPIVITPPEPRPEPTQKTVFDTRRKILRRAAVIRAEIEGYKVDMARAVVPQIGTVQTIVCRHYGVPLRDILSAIRTRDVVRVRQVAMWLCRRTTLKSYPEIGRRFGGRDHTTVLHSERLIEALRLKDPVIAQELELLTVEVLSHPSSKPVSEEATPHGEDGEKAAGN